MSFSVEVCVSLQEIPCKMSFYNCFCLGSSAESWCSTDCGSAVIHSAPSCRTEERSGWRGELSHTVFLAQHDRHFGSTATLQHLLDAEVLSQSTSHPTAAVTEPQHRSLYRPQPVMARPGRGRAQHQAFGATNKKKRAKSQEYAGYQQVRCWFTTIIIINCNEKKCNSTYFRNIVLHCFVIPYMYLARITPHWLIWYHVIQWFIISCFSH